MTAVFQIPITLIQALIQASIPHSPSAGKILTAAMLPRITASFYARILDAHCDLISS